MTTTIRPARLATQRPDDARRLERTTYALTCPCGWSPGTITGAPEAARLLRRHPCRPSLAGPMAELIGGRR